MIIAIAVLESKETEIPEMADIVRSPARRAAFGFVAWCREAVANARDGQSAR